MTEREEPTIVNIDWDKAIIHESGRHPRAEVRDPDTGEVIFPAVKGPLQLIEGGAFLPPANRKEPG